MSNEFPEFDDQSEGRSSRPIGPGTNPADLPGSSESYVVQLGKPDGYTSEPLEFNHDRFATGSADEYDPAIACELRARWDKTTYQAPIIDSPEDLPFDILYVRLNEDGSVDPLAAHAMAAALGVHPSELATMLELLVLITAPLQLAQDTFGPYHKTTTPPRDHGLGEIIDQMNAAAANVPSLIPLPAFTRFSEHRRTLPIGGTESRITDWLRYAPLFTALIAQGPSCMADPDLTPEDYHRAADARNRLTAWQAGTNRARAEFGTYIEDPASTDNQE